MQLRVRAQEGLQIKICFSTIKDLSIGFFSNKGIFVSQTSYGYAEIWSSFSSDFNRFSEWIQKLLQIGYKSGIQCLGHIKPI